MLTTRLDERWSQGGPATSSARWSLGHLSVDARALELATSTDEEAASALASELLASLRQPPSRVEALQWRR